MPGPGVPSGKSPVPPPALTRAWDREQGDGWWDPPPWAHLLLTKAHNKLSFKKARGNLRQTRQKAENFNSFTKLNGEKKRKSGVLINFCDCFRLEATGQCSWSNAL